MPKGKQVDFSKNNQFKSKIEANPTADRLQQSQDKDGTIALLDDVATRQAASDRLSDIVSGFAAATDGQILTKQGTAIEYAAPASGGDSIFIHPGFRNGVYYFSHWIAATNTSATVAAGFLNAQYIRLSSEALVDRLACEVTVASATGGVMRMGVYQVGADGRPSNLLADSGDISIATTGVKEAVIGLMLEPGWYALMSLTSLSASFKATTSISPALYDFGFPSIPGATVSACRAAQAYGALPAVPPTLTVVGGPANNPSIGIRVA